MSGDAYVLGVGVWTPEATDLRAWLSHGTQPAGTRPAAHLLPTRMRGRASLLTAMFAEVVEQAARAASVDPASLPSVFGSAYGEMGTTSSLLQQLAAAGARLSPAKFQASVHNTAAGQLSIALHNPRFSTSLAAGHDTLAMSLLEACGWLAAHPGQLLLACADEAASPVLQPELSYPPLAAAFVLGSAPVPDRTLARISAPRPCEHAIGSASTADNPVAPALGLVRALCSGERCQFQLNPASPLGYAVQIESYRRVEA